VTSSQAINRKPLLKSKPSSPSRWLNQYGASSFHHQCTVAFGAVHGGLFYELVNNVFDSMPVAAVISDQVFCCHGGIPEATTYKEYGSITQVRALPAPAHP
jgi:hypothetical protein